MARSARENNLARIVLASCGRDGTDWVFENVKGSTYRIKDPAANLYLNVWDEKPTENRELVTSSNATTAGSQWYLTEIHPTTQPMPPNATLDQMTFLTTHNAFTNFDDARWSVVNQVNGIDDQLGGGVRSFMLDTHLDPTVPGSVRLCHTGDEGCGSFIGITYADPAQTLSGTMTQFVGWLNRPENRNEIITVHLENYVVPSTLRTSLDQVNGLRELVFNPDAWGVRDKGWPKISDMVKENKRILILNSPAAHSDLDTTLLKEFGVAAATDWTVENYWSLGSLGADVKCVSRWPGIPLTTREPGFNRLFVMNHFRDVPTVLTAAIDNGTLRSRAENICMPAARAKPNYVAVDMYDKVTGGDGKLPLETVNYLNTFVYHGD
jgi:hypothetical protein